MILKVRKNVFAGTGSWLTLAGGIGLAALGNVPARGPHRAPLARGGVLHRA